MSKEERHDEIIKRLDTLSFRLNEIVQALNNLQHPERSVFGPGPNPGLGETQAQRYNPQPFPYAGDQMSQPTLKGGEQT